MPRLNTVSTLTVFARVSAGVSDSGRGRRECGLPSSQQRRQHVHVQTVHGPCPDGSRRVSRRSTADQLPVIADPLRINVTLQTAAAVAAAVAATVAETPKNQPRWTVSARGLSRAGRSVLEDSAALDGQSSSRAGRSVLEDSAALDGQSSSRAGRSVLEDTATLDGQSSRTQPRWTVSARRWSHSTADCTARPGQRRDQQQPNSISGTGPPCSVIGCTDAF